MIVLFLYSSSSSQDKELIYVIFEKVFIRPVPFADRGSEQNHVKF
ncbi:hypothetical protein RSC2_00235 [Bacillus paralicheniformis]|nr:hypothetical protein RSC1_02803 [Bacillus paralicheniformis]BCE08439.1 hypothetical protein RSC2_00235 [Bacillus paralicheniformis]